MRERLGVAMPAIQEEPPLVLREPTLRKSLGEKEIPLQQRRAISILDRMQIPLDDKRLLFFYHLWQQTGSFAPIKEYGDIREDPTIDSMLNKVLESDRLVKEYTRFDFEYEELTSPKNKLSRPKVSKKVLFLPEAEESFFARIGEASDVLSLKNSGTTNKEVAKRLGISIKRAETISRALILFNKTSPTPSGKQIIAEQNQFLFKVRDLRLKRYGNQEISISLGVSLEKVEHAARFLLWLRMIEPISKSRALKTRWKREEHKREVLSYLKSLDPNDQVSLRKIHISSGIKIGYDQFVSIYHELEIKAGVPPIRKSNKRVKDK